MMHRRIHNKLPQSMGKVKILRLFAYYKRDATHLPIAALSGMATAMLYFLKILHSPVNFLTIAVKIQYYRVISGVWVVELYLFNYDIDN